MRIIVAFQDLLSSQPPSDIPRATASMATPAGPFPLSTTDPILLCTESRQRSERIRTRPQTPHEGGRTLSSMSTKPQMRTTDPLLLALSEPQKLVPALSRCGPSTFAYMILTGIGTGLDHIEAGSHFSTSMILAPSVRDLGFLTWTFTTVLLFFFASSTSPRPGRIHRHHINLDEPSRRTHEDRCYLTLPPTRLTTFGACRSKWHCSPA